MNSYVQSRIYNFRNLLAANRWVPSIGGGGAETSGPTSLSLNPVLVRYLIIVIVDRYLPNFNDTFDHFL